MHREMRGSRSGQSSLVVNSFVLIIKLLLFYSAVGFSRTMYFSQKINLIFVHLANSLEKRENFAWKNVNIRPEKNKILSFHLKKSSIY
jgi:hypothetical protein